MGEIVTDTYILGLIFGGALITGLFVIKVAIEALIEEIDNDGD